MRLNAQLISTDLRGKLILLILRTDAGKTCSLNNGNSGKTCYLTKTFAIRDWLLRGKLILILRTASG